MGTTFHFFHLQFFVFNLMAAPVVVDFDDRDKPEGTEIRSDYLLVYGVQFSRAHICQPYGGAYSGAQALSEGGQFNEFSPDPLRITFNGLQSRVRFQALRLLESKFTVTATMKAMDANKNVLDTRTASIQSGLQAVQMEISTAQKQIRHVQLEYRTLVPTDDVNNPISSPAHEVIDSLEFDDLVVPMLNPLVPSVKIIKPQNGDVFRSDCCELQGEISYFNPIINVRIKIQPDSGPSTEWDLAWDDSTTPATFGSISICGLSPGRNSITVTATELGGKKGSFPVTVYSVPPVPPTAFRKLGVYTLGTYEDGWKDDVSLPEEADHHADFWDLMVNGMGSYTTDKSGSKFFKNRNVIIENIVPIPGNTSWEDFDFVFFYGHNNTIGRADPTLPNDPFEAYVLKNDSWVLEWVNLKTTGWGTPDHPFWYYADRPITNADQYPGAVVYLYPKHTASVLGGPYDFGGGERRYRKKWDDPPQKTTYGKLGSKSLKWLILDGCQAVVNANDKGDYIPLAYNAFKPIHGGYHIILGHRKSFSLGGLGNLSPFAYDLLAGVPIQTAYFDRSPDRNSSAIAAENMPFSWATSTMENDNWLHPVSVPSQANVFSERWIYSYGSIGQHHR